MVKDVPLTDLSYQKAIATRTPEEMVKHLNEFVPSFEPRFSAGDWFAGKSVEHNYDGSRVGTIRFHKGYRRPMELQEKFEMYARLKEQGLVAVEAHYHPKYGEIKDDNIHEWEKFHEFTGLRIKPALNAHYDEQSEWGSLSNPYPSRRKNAIYWLTRTLRIARNFGEDSATVWPGIDGYENPFAQMVIAAKQRFTDSMALAMDEVPGMRVSAEQKPYEPRRYILYGTSGESLQLARDVEAKLANGVNRKILERGIPLLVFGPEIGHMKMVDEDVAAVYQMYAAQGRLNHTHWNAHSVGTLDWDFDVGTVSPENIEHGLYSLMMIGYNGLLGIDIDPQYMDTETALTNCMDAMKSVIYQLKKLDHEQVILSANRPADNRGRLEQLVTRMRTHPGDRRKLSRLPGWVEPRRDI